MEMGSGGAFSSVVTESSLSAGVRSSWSPPARAVRTISVDALSATLTTIVPLADANCASVPSVQVTVLPERLHRPVVGVATSAENEYHPRIQRGG